MNLCLRIAAMLLMVSSAVAQQPTAKVDFQRYGKPLAKQPSDPDIAAALREVSPAEMRKTIEALVSFHNRNTAGGGDITLPPHHGVDAAATWIRARFEAISKDCGNCLEIHEDTYTQPAMPGARARILKPTPLTSIYAVMKGTSDPDRRVLVTGHYDSFFVKDMQNTRDEAPGANDDASGTAVSLECARVLTKHRFPATIVFATVTGEEQGLLGSRHLAQTAKKETWNLEAVLNNDIVGGDTTPADLTNEDKHRVRVFSEGISLASTPEQTQKILAAGYESDSSSRQLARMIADVARTYTEPMAPKATTEALKPTLVFRLDRYGRGGDHSSFNREGFTGVRFTEWRENFDHQHQVVRVENGIQFGDLIQFDDFPYMARVARLNAATLATLASAPPIPQNVQFKPSGLNNDTTMTWTTPADAPATAHDEVVWRETNAADWQYSSPASAFELTTDGSAHTLTLPVSKDNVILAIRSCDSKGHCSPAAAPLPR
jgi:hypothetical protein